ncbi:MAG TPA: response regulator transcription factor [Spirochaetia bacterium]|nr:response regulator transcription factor [Spirochaetia bacterium]
MNGSILLVEDDNDIAELIALYLRRDSYEVVVAATGEDALLRIPEKSWDLFLLDLNLPGIDGFRVLEEVRRSSKAPVIVVSARSDDADAIYGLGAGADEYVTKPFSPKVLVARVRAMLRRATTNGEAGDVGHYHFGDFELDVDSCILQKKGKAISVPPKEFDLLCYLVRNAGTPHTPSEIYEKVWDTSYGDLASVAVHVQRLRRRIEPNPRAPRYICTQRGYGYLFNRDTLS